MSDTWEKIARDAEEQLVQIAISEDIYKSEIEAIEERVKAMDNLFPDPSQKPQPPPPPPPRKT